MSNQTKDGGPAFPVPLNQGEAYKEHGPADGMTLRDYFAAKALGGLIGGRSWGEQMTPDELTTTWANAAYVVADKMLAARNQTNTKD